MIFRKEGVQGSVVQGSKVEKDLPLSVENANPER